MDRVDYILVKHGGGGGHMRNYMAIRTIHKQIAWVYVVDVVGSHKQSGVKNFLLSLTGNHAYATGLS